MPLKIREPLPMEQNTLGPLSSTFWHLQEVLLRSSRSPSTIEKNFFVTSITGGLKRHQAEIRTCFASKHGRITLFEPLLIKKDGNFRFRCHLFSFPFCFSRQFITAWKFCIFFLLRKVFEKFQDKKINGCKEMSIKRLFCFNYSYIDFLCNMLDTTQSLSEDRSSLSSASSSPAPCNQFQNGSTGSPIVPNEKLSYMFNVWRMDSEWSSSTGKIE